MASPKSRRPAGRFQQVGLLTAIPFVLLVGPATGYWLGTTLDARWTYGPWGLLLGIVLGFAASARVTVQLIRQAKSFDTHG